MVNPASSPELTFSDSVIVSTVRIKSDPSVSLVSMPKTDAGVILSSGRRVTIILSVCSYDRVKKGD